MAPSAAGNDRAESVAIQADGNIVAAGYAWSGTTSDFALARYLAAPSGSTPPGSNVTVQ